MSYNVVYSIERGKNMELAYTYYKYDGWFIGFLNDYPDYLTQGETLDELENMLKSLHDDIKSDEIPYIRHPGIIKITA
jgi:predicted RNase H-like HicB family nuclease